MLARIPVTFDECSFFLIDKNNFNLCKVVGGCGNLMQSGLFPSRRNNRKNISGSIIVFPEIIKKFLDLSGYWEIRNF
jgi:hypothetical protein